jgi:hypothetical protein
MEQSTVTKLEIDVNYLLFAWQDDSPDTAYYLDSDTGSVVLVQRDLEDLDELREEIELHPNRFIYVPKPDPLQPELDLSDYIFTVADPELKAQLEVAAEGRDKFGSCKRILSERPEELARWKSWQEAAVKERVRKWLAAHDLEAA